MIQIHPTIKSEDEYGYKKSVYVVKCDHCGNMARKTDLDPGEASEKARKEGFYTVKGPTSDSPRVWRCLKCPAQEQ